MHPGLIQVDDDWWPARDRECRGAVMKEYKDIKKVIQLCRRTDVAIQAGGNCGIYPRYLARYFGTVYTFEPDLDNFICLNLNVPHHNVVRMQAALGVRSEPVAMVKMPNNVGAHYVGQHGAIPVIRVDDLMLPACDLIQFDLEGYEYWALEGAAKTIAKYKPVLMIEDKGHHTRFGLPQNALRDILDGFGYRVFMKVNRDIVLLPKE